jgi:hydrogenase maturation protease
MDLAPTSARPGDAGTSREGGAGPSVAVVGVGNVLTGDDALGPTVVRHLEATYELGEGVTVLDAGTPGADLAAHVAGLDALVVVDTVRAVGAPGTLVTYRGAELLRRPLAPRVNPHAPGLQETLLTLELTGGAPRDVLLVGVVPASVEVGIGMSPPVRRAVPEAIRAVLAELARLGVEARPRELPRPPDLWWEGGPSGA